ncbi:MAG: hypothetical protein PVG27_03980 [Chloroflexota bacterium]|jgi:hypothetical protein
MLVNAHRTTLQALLVALLLCLILPLSAIAAGKMAVRTDSTYRLNPGQQNVTVNVNVAMTNRAAPSYSVGPCSPGSSQSCRFKTNYYYNQWGYIYVPVGARNIRFSPGVNQRLNKTTKHYKRYLVTFPNLNYGQTRRFKVTYELPGGRPRSKHETRVLDAYSYFCWYGQPGDSGSVSVRMPPGYKATTWYEQVRTKSNKKGTTITGKVKGSPARFYACTDATKPSKLLRTTVTSPSGQQVVVEGWPEDPEWSETMSQAVQEIVPALEELIGMPIPLEQVTIREVTKQSLDGYGSSFGLRRANLRLGDHIDSPAGAARGLAMAWFNDRRIRDTWLRMGLSDWAGFRAVDDFCIWPSDYPGKGQPKLRTWKQLKERPTEQQEAIVDWQYEAACWLVQKTANRIGEDRMREVMASLINGTSKYGPQPGPTLSRKRKSATWKDWLDAVDEIGMIPAGWSDLTLAEADLKEVGVATARDLKGRAKTRRLYHDALAEMGETPMPRLVNLAMDRWDWGTARKAIPLAAETYAAIEVRAMSDDEREAFLADFSDAWSFKALNKVKKRAETYRPPTVAEQPEQPAS